jgi:hypothetical protein
MGMYDDLLAAKRNKVGVDAANMAGSGSVFLAAKGGERMRQGVNSMFGIEEPEVISARAEQAKNAQLQNILSKYANASTRADFTSAFSELMANGFPEHAAKVQEHLKNMPKPKDIATSIEEYQFSVNQGDKRTYAQFMADNKGSGVTVRVGDDETITPDGMKLIKDDTTESGYRFVPIEGGEAWQELEDKKQDEIEAVTRDELALATDSQTTYVMETEIDSALKYLADEKPSAPVVGKAAEFYMGMPDWLTSGSPAVGFRTNISTIQGIIGFDRLQRMRDESETGGALGQVAVLELLALQGTLGQLNPLDPKEKTIERLKRIKAVYVKNMNIIRENFSEEELIKFGFSDTDIGGTTTKSQEQLIKDELAKRNT